MSSDADYAAFLDKANQDTSASASSQKQDKGFAQTKAVDTEVPGPISGLDAFYMSETDEPFEPVALKFEGATLDEGSFGELLGHSGEVEEQDVSEWNVKNAYGEVVDAVKKAGNGKVQVFRVAHGATRCEYYVVALVKGKVVGVKAKAVES